MNGLVQSVTGAFGRKTTLELAQLSHLTAQPNQNSRNFLAVEELKLKL